MFIRYKTTEGVYITLENNVAENSVTDITSADTHLQYKKKIADSGGQLWEYCYVNNSTAYQNNIEGIEVEELEETVELIKEIKENSLVYLGLNTAIKNDIARTYSIEDEIQLLRSGSSEEVAAYNTFVNDIIAHYSIEKSKIGL